MPFASPSVLASGRRFLLSRLNRAPALWGSEITKILLSLSTIFVLARAVSPATLGKYMAVTAFLFIMPRMLDAGLPQSVAYFLRARSVDRRALLRFIFVHVLVSSALAYLLLLLVALFPFSDAAVTEALERSRFVLLIYLVSELLALLVTATFVPSGRFAAYSAANLVAPFVLLVGVAILPLMGRPASLDLLLGLLTVSSLCGSSMSVLVYAMGGGSERSEQISIREFYHYGFRSWGSSLAKVIGNRLDRLILTSLLVPALYAHYALAVAIRDIAVLPANLYAQTLRNRQTDQIVRENDLEGARRLLGRCATFWFCLGLAGATVALPLWAPIVDLVFGDYAETAAFLRVLGYSCAPLAIVGFTLNHLYAIGRPGLVTLLSGLSLLVTAPGLMLAIRWFGAETGAAYGALACTLVIGLGTLAVGLRARPGRDGVRSASN